MSMADSSTVFPASFAQTRMWFLDRLDPGSVDYNMCQAARIRGALNVAALESALNEIVKRHATLRTTFQVQDGTPVQVVATSVTHLLPVTDLTHFGSEREAQAEAVASVEAQRPFDLQRGPLFRSRLLRLGPQDHLLVLSMYHIVYDAWSGGVLWNELSALYSASVAGRPCPLPALPIQYAEFAVWQRQRLQGKVLREHLAYWQAQLAGAPPWLDLPTDYPRSASLKHAGKMLSATLPARLRTGITALSRREMVTPFMTLLAAFAVLLARYSGQEDLIIGVPFANRNRVEMEDLIGLFVNTLPLRVKLSGNPTFLELLRDIREVTLAAHDHQDLPFEKLVEHLQPERHLSRTPVFQVAFDLAYAPKTPPQLTELHVETHQVSNGRSKFDLSLRLETMAERLSASLEYPVALFDDATACRLLGHYQTLLESIVASPDAIVGSLPILTPAECRQLLVDWAGVDAPYPAGKCIHELVQEQVQRSPRAVAMHFAGASVTYGELNARANRLARHLRRLGVGPDSPVGICLERSPELMIAVLAVLKAGGAYVPLDPEYPHDRLGFVVADTGIHWIVTREDLQWCLPRRSAAVVRLGPDRPLLPVEDETDLPCNTSPDNLAYVIYTSGSSGRPKGVCVPHRGAVNYLSFYTGAYGLHPGDIVLQLPSLSFDAALADLIGPLTFGGQVVLPNTDEARDPSALVRLMRERQVTCLLSAVVTVLGSLVEAAADDGVPIQGLRLILTGGEALPTALWHRAAAVLGPQVRIVNQYGPTETTLVTTGFPAEVVPVERTTVPIGRPIPNTRMYVLDRNGNPVPIGVRGELYIGGVSVTRGYLKRPDLTAASFVPDAFSGRPGGRLYRTGDLARYLPDGNLEFLGRADHQVKIRGNRVELGEIEAVLRQHPAVRRAVTVLREDRPGEPSLVAYVMLASGHTAVPTEWRAYLKGKLPAYMLPDAWVVLESLPLTSAGKVDRRALPPPDSQRVGVEQHFAAPRDAIEEVLASIFAQVLKLEVVGIHDGFFDLGGHSLLAMQVVARVRRAFGIDLSLRAMFETPTVAELSEIVRTLKLDNPRHPLASTGRNAVQ